MSVWIRKSPLTVFTENLTPGEDAVQKRLYVPNYRVYTFRSILSAADITAYTVIPKVF